MPLFVIERNFADQLNLGPDVVDATEAYNQDANLRWLFSFLSTDRKKTYCLYEAENAEALQRQARDLGFPADVIVEVGEVNPAMFSGHSVTGHNVA